MSDFEAFGDHGETWALPHPLHGYRRGAGWAGGCHSTGLVQGLGGARPLAQEVPEERLVVFLGGLYVPGMTFRGWGIGWLAS